MADHVPKPAPTPSDVSRFYWEAAVQHRLVIQRCESCGVYIHWPQLRCPKCGSGSDRLGVAEVSGRGTVYAFTIVHHVFHPGFADNVPYVLAMIELAEQADLRVVTNIVGSAHEDVYTGMPVEVTFEDIDGRTVPQFRPTAEANR